MQRLKATLLLGFLLYISTTHGASNKTLDLKKKDAQVVYIKPNVNVDFGKVYYFDGQTDNNGNLRLSTSDDGPPSGLACHYMQKVFGKLLFIEFSEEGIKKVRQSATSDFISLLIPISLQKGEPKANKSGTITVNGIQEIRESKQIIPDSSPHRSPILPRAMDRIKGHKALISCSESMLKLICACTASSIILSAEITDEEAKSFENLVQTP